MLAEKVTGRVTDNGCNDKDDIDGEEIELTGAGDHSYREQKRITREKKPNKETGFREDNRKQGRIAEPTRHHGSKELDQTGRIG